MADYNHMVVNHKVSLANLVIDHSCNNLYLDLQLLTLIV